MVYWAFVTLFMLTHLSIFIPQHKDYRSALVVLGVVHGPLGVHDVVHADHVVLLPHDA